jgi:hypothetical protein
MAIRSRRNVNGCWQVRIILKGPNSSFSHFQSSRRVGLRFCWPLTWPLVAWVRFSGLGNVLGPHSRSYPLENPTKRVWMISIPFHTPLHSPHLSPKSFAITNLLEYGHLVCFFSILSSLRACDRTNEPEIRPLSEWWIIKVVVASEKPNRRPICTPHT